MSIMFSAARCTGAAPLSSYPHGVHDEGIPRINTPDIQVTPHLVVTPIPVEEEKYTSQYMYAGLSFEKISYEEWIERFAPGLHKYMLEKDENYRNQYITYQKNNNLPVLIIIPYNYPNPENINIPD